MLCKDYSQLQINIKNNFFFQRINKQYTIFVNVFLKNMICILVINLFTLKRFTLFFYKIYDNDHG
jgi:hypothetical protein